MIIIDDDGWLLSPDQWIQEIILWEIALMSSRLFWFHEISPARNSLLLLAVLEVLHMNKQLHLVDVFYITTYRVLWWVSKVFFSSLKLYFGHSKVYCCLMNMLLCHYLIPKYVHIYWSVVIVRSCLVSYS